MEGKNILPVVPLCGFVMFPSSSFNFELSRKRSILAAEEAIKTDQKVFIVTQREILEDSPKKEDLYEMGIVSNVKHIIHQGSSSVRVLAEGLYRARMSDFLDDGPFIYADVERCEVIDYENTHEIEALGRKAKDLFECYLRFLSKVPPDLIMKMRNISDIGEISDYISSNIILNTDKKQELLELLDSKERMEKLLSFLANEIKVMEIEEKIAIKLKNNMDKSHQDYVLREQMKVISQELGEEDDLRAEAVEYKSKLERLNLKGEVLKKLSKECDRFSRLPAASSEASISRNYIETCLSLPWNKRTKDKIDLDEAKEILDQEHFGLSEVKDRIIEILAVRKLSKTSKGQIICLEGPPGVGKTSVARSIARTMGRKYQRISLGGIKDESEIRGHRRTYLGALPGRIISSIKQSGVKNPLILLDEVDKMTTGYSGDPYAALLEVLDPEQNSEFFDHYIDLPFDLSEVLFITTANDKSRIPKPLRDRMEIINLYSYTHEEKFNIAKEHLIPKLFKKNGLKPDNFSICDEAINFLIENYIREAGVRELEKKINLLMMKTAVKIVLKKVSSVKIDKKAIIKMLGPEKYKTNEIDKNSQVGVVNGLAWTAVGGETMPIEVTLMKGKGKVQVTGSLGDVMKESAHIAVSYIRSNAGMLGISSDFYEKTDIHIHAPEGAVPKDGPSAGVTMTTALVSALSGIPVKQNLAMTGEITLKGRVLAIGGLKEKTMAAYREGLKTVIIPSENKNDLEKIDKKVKKSLKFVMVNDLSSVFKHSFDVEYTGKRSRIGIRCTKDEVLTTAIC